MIQAIRIKKDLLRMAIEAPQDDVVEIAYTTNYSTKNKIVIKGNMVYFHFDLDGKEIDYITKTKKTSLLESKFDKVDIIDAVCKNFWLSSDVFFKERIKKDYTLQYRIAIYLLYNYTTLSFESIGAFLADKNHSTISHHYASFLKNNFSSSEVQSRLNSIIELLNNNKTIDK